MLKGYRLKLCVECGQVLSENPEYIRDVITQDLVPVCTKCAKILPKLNYVSLEESCNG
jgi:hypothetical protein